VGDWLDIEALQIDIENSQVVFLGFGKPLRFVPLPRFCSHPVAEFFDHIDQHHADESLIFDQKY